MLRARAFLFSLYIIACSFVLSLVDGVSTIEELVDVSSMEPLEVLRTLYNLLSQNVISLRRPRR